jgi:hypothetical protein
LPPARRNPIPGLALFFSERFSVTSTQKNLAHQIETVEWHWLKPHLDRDALIVVSAEVDLALAATKVAADDSATVGAWISEGKLTKPSANQIDAWNADPAKNFRMLIVQPFVLVQAPGTPAEPEKETDP